MQLFSFGGYGLALAALALVVFGAYDSYPAFANVHHAWIKRASGEMQKDLNFKATGPSPDASPKRLMQTRSSITLRES